MQILRWQISRFRQLSALRVCILLAHLVAFWPMWIWYVRRLGDGGGAAWGLLSMAAALVFVFREALDGAPSHQVACGAPDMQADPGAAKQFATWKPGIILSAAFTLAYAVGYARLPPLALACLAVTALNLTLGACFLRQRFHAGIWGLCLISLPVMDSLQFYAGYPLSVIAAEFASGLLRLGGLAVVPQGSVLGWGDKLVAVDAPCSGIRMLWAGACFLLVLACYHRLSFPRLLVGGVISLVILVLANALRAAALFYPEAGIIPASKAIHTAIGVVVFAVTMAGITFVIEMLWRKTSCAR